jgi:hypothetical protein
MCLINIFFNNKILNDRKWIILEHIASVYEESIIKSPERCWIIREQGDRERVIGWLIWLKYDIYACEIPGLNPLDNQYTIKKNEVQESKISPVQEWVPVRKGKVNRG